MNKDIAIIGISGRFPMAGDLDELFENLKTGKDCITEISRERIRETALPPDRAFRKCGWLADIDKFDYKFFGISLAEAKTMCPEQRILLEIVYSAIENAGYNPASFSGTNTGVFVSTSFSGYYQHATERSPTLITGNAPEFLAAKIGRYFNLHGNASVIDTTCSSSLVAIHVACNELIIGDAHTAVVAGVNLQLFPFADEHGGLDTESPDGRSKAFSAAADGMSYGEVAGAIILKPLQQAIKDKDNIQAVIKGTAVNYNGNNSSSITAPDSRSQADVMLKAWKKARIVPTDLSYIEAHGSGTQLGDSLEFEALNLAFKEYTSDTHICPISTIKSNMGHGRNVSGMAGLLKTILSLKYKVLFPTIHFEEPGPLLDYENSAVYVNRKYCFWSTSGDKPRYAGVTSLGWSGTNCHIVLEEGPALPEGVTNSAFAGLPLYYHIPLSGKTPRALFENASALLRHIQKNKASGIAIPGIEDVAYTLAAGRSHYDFRLSYVVSSIEELADALSEDISHGRYSAYTGTDKLIFIFSDSQGISNDMIGYLSARYKDFKNSWNECEQIMPIDRPSLIDFAFQYCYYHLLITHNITTDHLLPLGIGKIILPVITRELSLEEGLKLARDYHAEEVLHKEERITRLLDRLAPDGNCTFLDMATGGSLREVLEKHASLSSSICYIQNNEMATSGDPVVHLRHVLYSRNFNNRLHYPWSIHTAGKRIELPTYQFEKNPCWLRDSPMETSKNDEGAGQRKYLLKEHAGHIENKLAEIFAASLQVRELSIHDDYFSLGGDSLKATKLILRINDLFHVSLDFEDIFDFPTVSLLAGYLEKVLSTVQKVILIWETVLQNKDILPEDDFFELGGHSLMATQVIVSLNKTFGIALNFEDIFRNPRAADLAAHVDSVKGEGKGAANRHLISRTSHQESYRLTYSQKRMWFLNYFVGGNSAYNNVFGICLKGDLDYAVFDKAFNLVIRRHESMRTIFRMTDEEPRQFILDSDAVHFKTAIIEVNGNVGETIDGLFLEEYNYAFDLSVFPLFRTKLIRIGDKDHICILNIHHIISDGWSMGVFLEDFYMYYEQILGSQSASDRSLPVQIKDYAEWQHGVEFSAILQQQESYWLNRFKEPVQAISLPIDHPRPMIQSFAGDALYFTIDRQQTEGLKKIARETNATIYMVLLAVYNIFLGKLSNSEDIAVGSPVAGRRFDGLESLIGLFANTIVIRNSPLASHSFASFLADVKGRTLEAFSHQDYPYEELVKKLLVERDTSRNPLFDAMFIFQNNRGVREYFGDIKMSPYPYTTKTARVDLVMEAAETDAGIGINFEYCTALFNKETIIRFVAWFRKIISMVIADKHIKIGGISFITTAEKNQVLNDFNNTRLDFPGNSRINRIFEEKALERALFTAISFDDRQISYRELNEKSDRLAEKIITIAGRGESIIGIMMPRSPEMIMSIISILKAGCAYLPIDPDYPVDRIKYMVSNSGLQVILTDSSLTGICDQLNKEISFLDVKKDGGLPVGERKDTAVLPYPPGNEDTTDQEDLKNLAYLIYTSGSTGRPKGVMIGHRQVINFVQGVTEIIQITPANTILCLTTISFDIFVLETILPLLTGARIVLASADEQRDPDALARLIMDQRVDFMQITPSHLKLLLSGDHHPDVLEGIKVLMVGGEAFPPGLLHELRARYNGRIYNMYGPTETTVWSTIQDLSGVHSINIGKPIANTTIRILDGGGMLLPVGIAGELCIGGEGVARGYWKNPELTLEKFRDDPYANNQIIYRTGDLARWLPDGSIEFLGRMDNQVKIRGFRIETGEIESQMLLHEKITDAVVIAGEKAGDKYLIGYYAAEKEIAATELRDYLAGQLPYYMVPSYFVHLNRIPLTPNGKTDRRALPDPVLKTGRDHIPVSGETEKTLAGIWAEVLHLEKNSIGTSDDFFVSGGHSIMAARLILRIQQQYPVNISLREIFEYSTITKQAWLIDQKKQMPSDLIPNAGKRDFYPASSAQEGLYYEYLLNKDNLSYNIFSAYRLGGTPDVKKIERSFRVLIKRHESLRTGLSLSGDQVIQRISEEVDFELATIDLGKYNTVKEAFESFVRPFDLSNPPLIRCGLLRHELYGHLLFVDIHHIVCDGISLNILMNDFKLIYKGRELKPQDIRYVDYASWQKGRRGSMEKQAQYWKGQLSGELPEIDLPVIQNRGSDSSYIVSKSILEIDKALYVRIKKLTADNNVSEFMLLLSAFYILLSKLSGNQDVIIGTDATGRTHPALSDLVGTFINVLPLRVQVLKESSFENFLSTVKDCVLDAFDNQEHPVDRIIDVHFSFANYLDNSDREEDGEFAGFVIEDHTLTAQYEFMLQATETDEMLRIAFIYSTDLYDQDTISLLMNYYYNILTTALDHPLIEIGNMEPERASGYMNTGTFR